MSSTLLQVKQLLSQPQKITIVSHRNPDGDAMGSALAMYHYLIQKQHTVTVVMPNEYPDFLAWMPGAENVHIFEKNLTKTKELIAQSDLIFTLDFNALHRTGELMGAFLQTLSQPFIMIDHHQQPDDYAWYKFSDTSYGSTCEMIFHFIASLQDLESITTPMATCLYTGIVTDSGSFRFPLTTPTTHRIAADLLERGVQPSEIHTLLFDNHSYKRLQLLGKALENLVILPEYHTSYITLSDADLEKFQQQKGDTEGIVNYGLTIKDINFTAIFIENKAEGIIKISFRSKGNVDVNQFARTYFEGGGHINAAGGKSFLSLTETVTKFITILATEKPFVK